MKKLLLSVGAVVGSLLARAEGGTSSVIDLTPATTALTEQTDAVSSWVTTNAPAIATFIGSLLVITLIWVVWRIVRKGANKIG